MTYCKLKPPDDSTPGRKPTPLAKVAVKLCRGEMTEPMKAVTFNNGRSWEIIERHPVFRGAVVHWSDVSIVERM